MNDEVLTLTYLNEDDRAYGLAGMAISLAALDAIDKVASVSLDNTDEPMVTFSHEYYFCGSPSISPKTTWDNMLRNFYITSAMVVGNVASRSLVRMKQREIPKTLLDDIFEVIAEEGRESCSLDNDELQAIYDRSYRQSQRIFGNPRVHAAIDEFVRVLSRRRILSGGELADELRLLQLI